MNIYNIIENVQGVRVDDAEIEVMSTGAVAPLEGEEDVVVEVENNIEDGVNLSSLFTKHGVASLCTHVLPFQVLYREIIYCTCNIKIYVDLHPLRLLISSDTVSSSFS
jgi:hypothetical protein